MSREVGVDLSRVRGGRVNVMEIYCVKFLEFMFYSHNSQKTLFIRVTTQSPDSFHVGAALSPRASSLLIPNQQKM